MASAEALEAISFKEDPFSLTRALKMNLKTHQPLIWGTDSIRLPKLSKCVLHVLT